MDTVKFVESVDESFKCSRCHNVLQDPMQTDCGHRYCKTCIETLIQKENVTCLNCDEIIEPVEIHKDTYAKREINKLLVKCSNDELGCLKELPLSDLPRHIQTCDFLTKMCLICDQPILKKNVDHHITNECARREISCILCHQKYMASEVEFHKAVCANKVITCICGAKDLTSSQLKEHVTICPEKSVLCPYSDYGCNFLAKQRDCEEHLKNNYFTHLDNFKKFVLLENKTNKQNSEAQNQIYEEELKILKKQNEEFQMEMNKQCKKIEGLQISAAHTMDKIIALTEKSKVLAHQEHVLHLQHDLQIAKERVKVLYDNNVKNSFQDPAENSSRLTLLNDKLNELENLLSHVDQQMALFEVRLSDISLRFQFLESTSYNGILVWKITDYIRKKSEACVGKCSSIYSQPFYSNRFGYKMCARVYLNGDGMGKGTHLSLFFVIMKGEYDDILTWPFNQRVTLMLLDQKNCKKHLTDSFKPDANSSSFKKPSVNMNIASGSPLFILQQVLESSDLYLKNDMIFIKISIDEVDH